MGNQSSRSIVVIGALDVAAALRGAETEVLEVVKQAYLEHGRGTDILPHACFLQLPEANRIIALPAYIAGPFDLAGIKWVASFPGNTKHNHERASAVLVLNDTHTGRPNSILEGSLISAARTAASAAIAAVELIGETNGVAAIIGCGIINYEIVRYLRITRKDINKLLCFDVDEIRAGSFAEKSKKEFPEMEICVARGLDEATRSACLVSFATTAATPYVQKLTLPIPTSVVLHISLRDIGSAVLRGAVNVTDDTDHACRAATSLHLMEKESGSRKFIYGSLSDMMLGRTPPLGAVDGLRIFSPFGLGILDLVVAGLVRDKVRKVGEGTILTTFLP